MSASKRYIPILIAIAMFGLIALQAIWLFNVYQFKSQELTDKTRDAILQTIKRLQKEEDSKLILQNIDSLLVTDNIIGSDTKSDMRVIVSNIKNKIKIDTLKWEGHSGIDKKIKFVSDSVQSTTIIKTGNGDTNKVIIHSESINFNHTKNKAKELETLFLKMALRSSDQSRTVQERINFKQVKQFVNEELLKRGIHLQPSIYISSRLTDTSKVKLFFSNHSSEKQNFYNKSFVSLPLYPYEPESKNIVLEVGFTSTISFVIKQMAGLLVLSLFITLLIAYVMIYTFRRMLSQEKLNQIKNDFVNNMTHELKTPIATMSLALDAISNKAIKNDERKFENYTHILKEENKKLNNHVEQVLQLALLESGKLALNKLAVDLNLLIKKSIQTHQLQIEEKKAKVMYEGEENAIVNADEFHMQNLFNNIIDNALKYSANECIVKIKLQKRDNSVIISIADNGPGIDTHLHEKIFEKFFRVQGGNLHDVKGFGIGLSYVKSVIEAHNGNITLKSDIGKGSEFIINFPLHGV